MPAQATALVGSNYYKFNGQWQWTSDDHPGCGIPQKLALAPRVGAAITIDDKTALRVGYARYYTPTEMILSQAPVSGFETVSFLEPPFFGSEGFPEHDGPARGRPAADDSPILLRPPRIRCIPINGKGAVRTSAGEELRCFGIPADLRKPSNDRFNVNFQRQLPGQIVASATWFMNIGNQHYTRALNNIDPNILVDQQNAVNVTVDNPFYNYLTPELFPGPLRNQKTVPLTTLLTKYPQYGGLYEVGTLRRGRALPLARIQGAEGFQQRLEFPGSLRLHSREDRAVLQRAGYVSTTISRIRTATSRAIAFAMAGTYELPFGTGAASWAISPGVVNAIVGGWKITGLSTYISGAILRFGKMNWNGQDPTVDNPSPNQWFNTSVFSPIAANTFVIRSNPLQFDNLTGPHYYVLDATLSKNFRFTERIGGEFKMAAYNALNRSEPGNPNMDSTAPSSGRPCSRGRLRRPLVRKPWS